MKKKKLFLKRETLAHLQTAALRLVNGQMGDSFEHTCEGCESLDPCGGPSALGTCACTGPCLTNYTCTCMC